MSTTITPADRALANQLGLELIQEPAAPHKARKGASWQVRNNSGRSVGSLHVSPSGLRATKLAVGVASPEMTVADALRWIAPAPSTREHERITEHAHERHDVEGLPLPDGWRARPISPDHVEIAAPSDHVHCYVTVDFAARCFRGGLCTTGPAAAKRGTAGYHGHGWRETLIADAVRSLEAVLDPPRKVPPAIPVREAPAIPVLAIPVPETTAQIPEKTEASTPAPSPPTLPQTIVLLALSRGEKPRVFPPITRAKLLSKRWISLQQHEITDEGRRALATSTHLAKASRILHRKTEHPVWQ
jgi:hypothetical protein